jgi:hypothetical protein
MTTHVTEASNRESCAFCQIRFTPIRIGHRLCRKCWFLGKADQHIRLAMQMHRLAAMQTSRKEKKQTTSTTAMGGD